ncbi:hypothetical protein X777_16155 [Ooceraea biroi]|uniref:Uncharacterized protein n=1 Tax=Ooceraea biroi TaxID=2015173 RepID=A0A026WVA9_OOCBI|nr:hypothetical protein X777_16155 [Ooceraea biroi]
MCMCNTFICPYADEKRMRVAYSARLCEREYAHKLIVDIAFPPLPSKPSLTATSLIENAKIEMSA